MPIFHSVFHVDAFLKICSTRTLQAFQYFDIRATYPVHLILILCHMIVIYQESEKQKQKEDEEEGEKEIGEYGVNMKIKNVRVTSLERKCVLRGLYSRIIVLVCVSKSHRTFTPQQHLY